MRVVSCMLESDNQIAAGGDTLGNRILHMGKQCLWDERAGTEIDTIVIHFISAVDVHPRAPFSLEHILKIFTDYSVSSHYLIDRRGTIRRLVPEEKKAWHCGASIMPSPDLRQGVNEFSIGIELVATQHSGFTLRQYSSCAALCADIESRHGIKRYVGHEDIAGAQAVSTGLRTVPKIDPGPLFNWQKFHEMRLKALGRNRSVRHRTLP